jgi:hypothetical protein
MSENVSGPLFGKLLGSCGSIKSDTIDLPLIRCTLLETPGVLKMADVLIERRKFSRKRLKLTCYLQIGYGVRARGFTHDLSHEGAMAEFQQLPKSAQNMTPKAGDMGSLMLQYHKRGEPESLKIGCRVMHTQANFIGLLLLYLKMSNLDKQNLDMILDTESGVI